MTRELTKILQKALQNHNPELLNEVAGFVGRALVGRRHSHILNLLRELDSVHSEYKEKLTENERTYFAVLVNMVHSAERQIAGEYGESLPIFLARKYRRLLETIDSTPCPLSVLELGDLHQEVPLIRNTLNALESIGLVQKCGLKDYYELTKKGERLLGRLRAA